MHFSGTPRTRAARAGAAFLFVLALSGCAGPDSFGGSRQAVEDWSQPQGFVPTEVINSPLHLFALTRGSGNTILHVYIEGDGAAWSSPWHPPRDPSPERPIALALAAQDPAPAVAYLGRPCQYLDTAALVGCPSKYWTSHRFAPEVVNAYQQALNVLKTRFEAEKLWLIGYSGGGVLALLLAGSRVDVVKAVTVASPVSVGEWARWHKVSPLHGSLDPETQQARLPPTIHFIGGSDRVVPIEVVAPFVAKNGGQLHRVPEFGHECCWSLHWRRLLEEIR